MRKPLDADRIRTLMRELGRAARGAGRVYLIGGTSAVLVGWRESTVDADLKLDPEPEGAFEAIRRLKDELDVNVELTSPEDFIPPLPDLLRYPAVDADVLRGKLEAFSSEHDR